MSIPRYACNIGPEQQPVVLLVEDEPLVREATVRILQNAGVKVLPVEDAGEALREYKEHRPQIDLLISDLVLPDRSGRQLGEEIHRLSPQLPILLTSGYLCEYDEVKEDQTYYLPKPYSRSDLLGKIGRILGVRLGASAHAS